MGMYDEVICEYPLPGPECDGFQTKDFPDPSLTQYRITKEGRLLEEVVRYEDHSDPNAEGLMRIRGMATKIKEGWKDIAFHGTLNFYSIAADGEWVEYDAKFTEGTLVSVTQRLRTRKEGE